MPRKLNLTKGNPLKPDGYKLIVGIDPSSHRSGWAKLYIGKDIKLVAGIHLMPFHKLSFADDELAREVSKWQYDYLFFEGDFRNSSDRKMDGISRMTFSWIKIHFDLNFLKPDQWREILGMKTRGSRGDLKRQSIDFILSFQQFYPKVKFYKCANNLPDDIAEASCIAIAGALKLNLLPGIKINGA